MKIINLIYLVFFFLIDSANAQSVNKAVILHSIDQLNCLTIEFSVKEADKEFKCDCAMNPSFELIMNGIPNELSSTKALSTEIDQIKGQINTSLNESSVIKYLCEDIFEEHDKFSKIYNFEQKYKIFHNYKDFKNNLQQKITKVVREPILSNGQVENIDNSSSQDKAVSLIDSSNKYEEKFSERKENVNTSSNIFSYEIDVIALVLILIILLIILKLNNKISLLNNNSSLKHINDNRDKTVESTSQKQHQNFLTNEMKSIVYDLKKLEKDFKELSSKLDKEKELIKDGTQTLKSQGNIEIDSQPEQPSKPHDYFFLSTPNADGSFNNSSSSSHYKEGASIYKFTKLSLNDATFQIDENQSSIKMALQFPQKSIKPVCDSENEYEPKFNKLITKNPGRVTLEGDKWIVKLKAKIRYEN